MDDLYGRNEALRQNLDKAQIEYYGDIPAKTKIYLQKTQVIHPLTKRGNLQKLLKSLGWATKLVRYAKWARHTHISLANRLKSIGDAGAERLSYWPTMVGALMVVDQIYQQKDESITLSYLNGLTSSFGDLIMRSCAAACQS